MREYMTCEECQGWMLEARRTDFSPDTFVWRCIHCASIADPWNDPIRSSRLGKQLLLGPVKMLH